MAIKELKEKVSVGGGTTGISSVPDPIGGTATLPVSKKQGDGMQKAQGDMQDTDSENNTAPTGDMSDQNKATIASKLGAVKEHVDAMFNDEELSEEFREKATVIFEAAIAAKAEEIEAALDEQYSEKFEDAKVEIYEEMTARVDEYLNYIVEQWMEENQVAIESSLRTEIAEDFIHGMKNLFKEHYVEVPDEKYDVLGELAQRVEELEEQLNDTVNENIELKAQLSETTKDQLIQDVAEGLAATQVEKFKALAEGVEYGDAEEFKHKLEIVKENYFPSDKKASVLDTEEVESLSEGYEGNKVVTPVSNYVQAIARTIKR